MLAGKQQSSGTARRAESDAATVRGAAAADDAARLQHAIRRIHRHARPPGAREGLSPTQVAVLSALVHAGPQRSTDLAAREGLNATLVSRVLAKLEGAGLARRDADPDDRRVARIEATARGRRLLDQERAESASALREELERLDPVQRRTLAAALDVIELLGERLRNRPR
ncbi:MAG TPA: MarR family transcriptional regulator [Acidimicrobiales bacterium]|nr:MarR family transcriptional regulator [Acidimicrobiales bacterium]HVC26065.1 MarR family transcriptional regulator [Acidimicrobiales bacterium]